MRALILALSSRSGRRICEIALWAVLLTLAVYTKSYALIWSSNVPLFTYAASRAPVKPRPLNFYGLVLVSQGRWNEAERAFQIVAAAPGVPWDRDWSRAGTKNLQSLAALRRRSAR